MLSPAPAGPPARAGTIDAVRFGESLRSRRALLAVPVVIAAGAAFAVYDGGEYVPTPGATTTTATRLSGDPTPTSGGVPDATSSSTSPSGTQPSPTTTTEPAGPRAPWRGATLPRAAVPRAFLDAWERARNRDTCGLLVPSDTGPLMTEAEATFEPTPENGGWDIYLRQGARIVEILGLVSREAQPDEARPASFSRTWADGSSARYGPDDPGSAGSAPADPEATAFEATLTLPDQGCVYLIYDTLGKSHLEFVLERLRFVEGTR